MGDTNYFSGIVKILETPKQRNINQTIRNTTIRVEIPQNRKSKIITLVFWGNLSHEVSNFYKTNDYILIEGYLSFRPKKKFQSFSQASKQVIITALRVYPILLTSNRTS